VEVKAEPLPPMVIIFSSSLYAAIAGAFERMRERELSCGGVMGGEGWR
jgi:hypothetical protein